MFLDPYGMSVAWETIKSIADTHAIDLWILFPFAIGANRMTPGDMLPDKDWAVILSKVFGTSDWINRFYKKQPNTDLFGSQHDSVTKIVGADEILQYFLDRLRTVFPHVVEKPMIVYNSNNSPMYALCFAAGNVKGGKIALKIKVVRIDTLPMTYMTAFLREVVGKFLSGLVFALGYFWMIWDKNKQTWHDHLAKTQVVRV